MHNNIQNSRCIATSESEAAHRAHTRITNTHADAADDFKAMNTQVLGMSVDSQFSHLAWIQTPRNEGGVGDLKYPLVSDFKKVCVCVCVCSGLLSTASVLLGLSHMMSDRFPAKPTTVRLLAQVLTSLSYFFHTHRRSPPSTRC